MSKRIILKIENKGRVTWKTDSFWSMDADRSHAKTHTYESIPRLVKSYLSSINYNLDHSKADNEEIFYYDNMKLGYDFVEEIDICTFDFVKNGFYEYKIKYNKEINKFIAVDMRRKLKLEQIQKCMEENSNV